MKHTVSERALALVEKRLRDTKGRLTPQDAAASTGITVQEAYDALVRLMELYVTRVSYDENGNMLFAFEMPLRQRGTKTLRERWAGVREAVWRGFKVFYKIWIAVMVIVYFVVIAVLLLALMFASRSSGRDEDRDEGIGGNAIGGLFHVLAEGLRYAFWSRVMFGDYGVDDYGYRYRKAAVPRGQRSKEKSFIIAIYDLALGPERVAADPLSDEREIAAFLKAENGVIVPGEVVALSGGTIEKAEERMADYLARFQGEPQITEEGVVVGEFETFLAGSSTGHTDSDIIPYWQEYEAPYKLSGNSAGRNVAIIFMVLVTLVGGVVLGPGGGLDILGESYAPFFSTTLAYVLLSVIPILFGLTFLLLPILRWPVVKKREHDRLERNRKKRVMQAIFEYQLWNTTVERMHATLVQLGDKDLTPEETQKTLDRLVIDLHGDVELREDGTPVYAFRRLEREFEAAARRRGRDARLDYKGRPRIQ